MRLLTLFPVPLHFFLQDYFFLLAKRIWIAMTELDISSSLLAIGHNIVHIIPYWARKIYMRKLIVLLLFCALLTSLFAGGVKEKAEEKDYIVMAIPVDPDGLDPMATAAASTFQVTSNIYETLITVDENGRLLPSLRVLFSGPSPATRQISFRFSFPPSSLIFVLAIPSKTSAPLSE